MKQTYLKRIADDVLEDTLQATGAVLVEGPKWCGKTRTAQEKSKSELFMQDPDMRESYKKAADTKPSILLKGDTPRLLDEWQTAPVLWDAVRFAVDKDNSPGQFILTGSATPNDDVVQHTGTGRIARMMMRPMSLFESLESNGTISLKDIFDGNVDIESFSTLTIDNLAYAMVRGGWPASIGRKENVAVRSSYEYIDSVINMDVSKVDGIEKNPARVRALLRSLARNISTQATIATIKTDIEANEESISEKTISLYLNALRRIFVVEDVPAWNPAMRSKTAIRTSAKRHFVDPSIATAVSRSSASSVLEDFETFGLLFESLCIRDLRVYAQSIDGEVFHYRDKSGLEADAVVHLRDGRWGAIEIKLGSKEIEIAAENLKRLKTKINIDKMKEPSFLMILTGTEIAYKREDGVLIVPIGCLKN
jgi:predicted AAA+ superfamily ATPase